MSSVKKVRPLFRVGDWVKFDYGPKNRVLVKIIEDRGRLGVRGENVYRVKLEEELGHATEFEVTEHDLQAAPTPARLFLDVRYLRQGDSNVWRATTRSNGVFKGVKARGAVGYTTSFFEGEEALGEKHATVQVLIEVDPGVDEAALLADQSLMSAFIKRARAEADALFRSRHPRSRVEHVDVA